MFVFFNALYGWTYLKGRSKIQTWIFGLGFIALLRLDCHPPLLSDDLVENKSDFDCSSEYSFSSVIIPSSFLYLCASRCDSYYRAQVVSRWGTCEDYCNRGCTLAHVGFKHSCTYGEVGTALGFAHAIHHSREMI